MDDARTTAVLLAALTDAARAHGVYEETELAGVYDENWPGWYARHMTRTLANEGYQITPATTSSPRTTKTSETPGALA